MFFIPPDKYISPHVAFSTADGTQHPANWAALYSAKEKKALGIVEITQDSFPLDDRFYYVSMSVIDGVKTYINTPKDLDSLKESWVNTIRADCFNILQSSDWYITKANETNTIVPSTILKWRDEVRSLSNSTINKINSSTTVEELIENVKVYYPDIPELSIEDKTSMRDSKIKSMRSKAIKEITVTTKSGKVFDGNEASQARIANALLVMQIKNENSKEWKLADNSIVDVTIQELIEALILSEKALADLILESAT